MRSVAQAVDMAEAGLGALAPEVMELEGMSSASGRRLLNNLCALPGARYLEVGCWRGATACAALYHNDIPHWVVDDFSEFGGSGQQLQDTCGRVLGKPVHLIERDCFSFDPAEAGIADVSVYFYDGNHSNAAQEQALTHYAGAMHQPFVFVCDDWTSRSIRQSTRRAMERAGLAPLREWELMEKPKWWNGMYVGVLGAKERGQV